MTLLRVNFRGNVFVPLDHWAVEPGKGARENSALAIDHEFYLFNKVASTSSWIRIDYFLQNSCEAPPMRGREKTHLGWGQGRSPFADARRRKPLITDNINQIDWHECRNARE
jgi:hypothetical protein